MIALVRTTVADAAEAERITAAMVEERLAACANIEAPCRSIYRWHGRIERAEEVVVLFKTLPGLAEALAKRIAALHSYELPAIERWTAEVDFAVQQWVRDACR